MKALGVGVGLMLVLLVAILAFASCGDKPAAHPDNPDLNQLGDGGGALPEVPPVPSK